MKFVAFCLMLFLVSCATSAPSPTVAPTVHPTPEPTSIPTAIPTQSPPQDWRASSIRTDPMTDKMLVAFSTAAVESSTPDLQIADSVRLYVRCQARENPHGEGIQFQQIDVYIAWDRFMGAVDGFPGQVRFDGGEVRGTEWSESPDNDVTFYKGNDKTFARLMTDHEAMLVRLTDYRGKTHDAKFQIRGLNQHLQEHPDMCGWKP